MAGEATEPFMHADGRTIISGSDLLAGQRRVTLIAERLASIRADLDRPAAIAHGRQRELCQRYVFQFPPVK